MDARTFDPSTAPPALERTPFVSRSRARSPVEPELRSSDGSALPALGDAHVRWILVLALVLQVFAWWRVAGYQLADSVEFMERARILVRGEEFVDAGAVRPIGFSLVLMPIFALGEWFGLGDERALVWCVVLLEMAIGLVLVWRTMRIGARLAGRTGAIAAGFLAATNPVFLQYSTQPVSDLAAGVCIAFALELVLERGSFRRGLVAGLWLGLGFLVAYKTLLLILLLFAFVFVRDRKKHSALWRGLLPGILLAMLVQSTIDWAMHGIFGLSVFNYFVANVGGVISSLCMRVSHKTGIEWIYQVGNRIYDLKEAGLGNEEWAPQGVRIPPAKQPFLFYVLEAPTFLVWPVIAFLGVAILRTLVRPTGRGWTILAILVLALVVMSNKGSKDLRLLLPLLSLIAPFVAFGWAWIVDGLLGRWRATRGAVVLAGTAAVGGLSLHTLTGINVKHFGGYWDACDWVDEHARSTFAARARSTPWPGRAGEPEPLQVGYAYHWAVFLRHSPLVHVTKLPYQLNLWNKYAEMDDGGLAAKGADCAALEDLDVFVVHLPILSQNPDLMRFVNARFEVAAAFYDQRTYDDIGPILVLFARRGEPRAPVFFEITRGADEAAFVRERQLDPRIDFLDLESGDRVRLLGVEFTTLPPQGFGWITYHWRAPSPLARDWVILDRLTSPHEKNVWENNHVPAYGTRPTSTWQTDEILSESYLVVPSHEAYRSFGPVRPIGNAYRRGDLIPTRTWMKLVTLDPATVGTSEPVIQATMLPARTRAATPARPPEEVGRQDLSDGMQFALDDFVRVASFFVPVLAPWRLPDDGRPVED